MVRRLNASHVVGSLREGVLAVVGALLKGIRSADARGNDRLRHALVGLMRHAGLAAGRGAARTRPGASAPDIGLERARQNERARLARDLHDQTGQQVALLKLSLRALQREIHSAGGEATLAQINRLVDGLAEDLHGVVVGLRPAGLEEFGLVPVLKTLVEDWSFSTGIAVSIHVVGAEGDRNTDFELALYRIAQESLTNIGKHALTASCVSISVQCTKELISLTVENDSPDSEGDMPLQVPERSNTSHCGIDGMRERLFALGGWLDIASGPNGGMRVFAQIPLRRRGQ